MSGMTSDQILKSINKLIPADVLERYDDDSHVEIHWGKSKHATQVSFATIGDFKEIAKWVAENDCSNDRTSEYYRGAAAEYQEHVQRLKRERGWS